MKQYLLNSLLLAFVVLLQGCVAWNYGIEPIYPPSSKLSLFSGETVDSLMPTFRWKPYTANKQASNITYNLQILRYPSPGIVYERNNIMTTSHKINIKLMPNKHYIWRIKANYTEKGNKLVTNWNGWGVFMLIPGSSGGTSENHKFTTPDL